MLELENVINNSKKKLGSLREKLIGDNNQAREKSNIIKDLDEIIFELTASLNSKIDDQEFKKSDKIYKSINKELELILNNIPALIFYKDLNNNYIRVNKACVEANKKSKAELEGKSLFDIYPNDLAQAYYNDDLEVVKTKKPKLNIEEFIETQEGRDIYLTNKIPIINDSGIVTGILGFAINITKRKMIEEELRNSQSKLKNLNQELETRVLERTKELKESEERFKTLFEVAPASIVYSDLNANILMCNKQFLKLHGIRNPEMIRGINVSKFFLKKDLPKLRTEIQKSIEGKESYYHEYTMLKEDGTEFQAEASSVAVRDKNGIVVGIIGVAQDITNRKNSEIELRESEDKFRTITEQSFMGIIIIQDGIFKYFNQRAADINGYSVEEIRNWKQNDFAKLIHPEDREFVMEQAKKKQDGKLNVINHYSYRLIKKSGEIAWMDNYSKTIKYRDRTADLVMTEDITDKIIAEQQLKESEIFFRSITEQSLLGIIIIQDGILKYVNDITLNYSGYSRNEVINLPVTELLKFIHSEDGEIFQQALIDPTPKMTFRLITKDGDIKWIDLHTKTIFHKGKKAYLASFLDVTEIKEAEQIIKDEITKLKELDELKNEFVYRASHELKTPLNSIVSASSLLIDSYRDSLDDRAYNLINLINKGGKRLDELIGDLLDVSRIDSGKLAIQKKKENIVEIIKNCTKDLIFLINKRKLNIEFKNLQERFFIKVDKKRIEQVILNILSNSIKNTPSKGTISVDIKSEKKFIDLSITDTGVGFTKKEKEKLFQKFGKIERHGKGMDIITEGTGLGLYLSKEIIELHGGEIWVESQGRNKGTTIVIRLPNKK